MLQTDCESGLWAGRVERQSFWVSGPTYIISISYYLEFVGNRLVSEFPGPLTVFGFLLMKK